MLLEDAINSVIYELHGLTSQLPICTSFTRLGDEEIFCKMPLRTALGLGAALPIDSLDFAENIRSVDNSMVLYSSFIQKGDFCLYESKKEVSFNTHCETILNFIQENLNSIENNFNASLGSKLFISDEMFAANDFSGEVYGKLSTEVKNFVIENYNLIHQFDDFIVSIRGIYNMLGANFLTEKWTQIEECFGQQFSDFSSAIRIDPRRVNFCLGKFVKSRPKRSSFLSYLFLNGEEIDTLNNEVVDLAEAMNSNIASISKNEEYLFKKEKELAVRALSTSKKLDLIKGNFNALTFEMKNKFFVEENSVNNIYKFDQKSLNLEKMNRKFMENSRIIFDIVISKEDLACYNENDIFCINPKASWIQKAGGNLVIHLHKLDPAPQPTSYVSCIPDWKENKVSILHNTHMTLNSENFLVSPDYKIKMEDLIKPEVVNKDLMDLSSFLIQENIFVTTNDQKLGITCLNKELLFIKNLKFSCDKEIIWSNIEDDIHSAKGTISRSAISRFYQDSKLNLQLHEESELSGLLVLEATNSSSFEVMLEALNTLPTGHKVAMSLGVSGVIVLLFIVVIVCTRLFWNPKICCGPHPNTADDEQPDVIIGQPSQPVLTEERKASLTRRATQMVLSQLNHRADQ